MNLFAKLSRRAEEGRPIRVGLIGAGKFGSMFLAQARRHRGLHVVGIADLSAATARSNLALVGWEAERYGARDLDEAARTGGTHVGEDWRALATHPEVEILIEATGDPVAAVAHALAAFEAGCHVVNVTVEADAYCGHGLARRAEAAGVVYSMAYGDQPALVCDLVDWARTCGFPVAAAGRGHKWRPSYRKSTPETVWDHWGLSAEQATRGRLNPRMFNAFLDGSKPAIECAAIANACGLDAPEDGLAYPTAGADDLADVMRPREEGGALARKGLVEAANALTPDGEPVPYDLRQGVWVVIEGDDDYVRHCFEEYLVRTDDSGRYTSLYKRWHLIGLELPVSVAAVALRGEPTGVAREFRADVCAVAKRDLRAGETLDGEGGETVAGGLRPALASVRGGYLPLGLAKNVRLVRDVRDNEPVRYSDVEITERGPAHELRAEMERALGGAA